MEVTSFSSLLEETEAADAARQADAVSSAELAEAVELALASDPTAEGPGFFPACWEIKVAAA